MSWIYLTLAGALETVWALALKRSDGFSAWLPTLITVLAMAGSVWLLGLAMRTIPVGIAYAVWTAIGSLLVFLFGALLDGQAVSPLQAACAIGLVLCSLGLKFGA
jgi:quaternary ammonium compound-resistance protein SugE